MTADLTKIDKLFCKLDDATKGALLLAEHEGEVIEFFNENSAWDIAEDPVWWGTDIYRVRPAPAVMGNVTMYGIDKPYFPICGYIGCGQGPHVNPLTFTFPTRDGLHVPGVYTSPDGLQIVVEVAK